MCVTFQIPLWRGKKKRTLICLNCVAEFEIELCDKALKHTSCLFFSLIQEDLKIFCYSLAFRNYFLVSLLFFPSM